MHLFVRPKTSSCTHVAKSWHKPSQGKSELARSDALTVKLLQSQRSPRNIVEVKNMGSFQNSYEKLIFLDIANSFV